MAKGIRFAQSESRAKNDWQIKRELDKISAIKQAHNQVASDRQRQRLNNHTTGRWAAPHRICAEIKQALSDHTSDFLTRCRNQIKPSHRIPLFTSTDDLRFINDFHKRISNPINRTSDSASKQAIRKHDSQITDNNWRLAQMDKAMQNISSKSAQLAGLMQNDCEENNKSIRLCTNASMEANRQR